MPFCLQRGPWEYPGTALAREAAQRVETALIETYGAGTPPSVEDIQDIIESVLQQEDRADVAREYTDYRRQRAVLRAARAQDFAVSDNIPYRKIYEVLCWNIEHGCESVRAVNRLITGRRFADLVQAADSRYNDEIRAATKIIVERLDAIRMVIVAGPSSSGKTTTTIKASEQLAKSGVGVKAINIDHYFFDRELHPRDEFGDYNYERPQALDLELINEHLAQLLDGQTIRTPHYDFKKGKRELNVHSLTLGKKEVLLIDSLHGLYDEMTSRIPSENTFKLYVETLGQCRGDDGIFMRWADNRLLRRMIRDKHCRNMSPIETITHWHYVRKSELTDIIPYIKNADYVVNSALPYELPILKTRLLGAIRRAASQFHDDPRRLDAHIRANRVYDFLVHLRGVRDDSPVPGDSLLREFIGGSRYTY